MYVDDDGEMIMLRTVSNGVVTHSAKSSAFSRSAVNRPGNVALSGTFTLSAWRVVTLMMSTALADTHT